MQQRAHSLSRDQVGSSAEYEDVAVTTLDQALPDVTDATLVQIDTEGFDFKVLQGRGTHTPAKSTAGNHH